MVREHLSDDLIQAGSALLAMTDTLSMRAQGAMWVYDHSLLDWRFYLVTSLVDTLGRRRTYRFLLDAFERLEMPDAMTVEDVHLGSPNDPFFITLSYAIHVAGNGFARFWNCTINDVAFDGGIYRSVAASPNDRDAGKIEKLFRSKVRKLAKAVV